MATLGRNIKFPIYNADGSSFHNLEIRKSTVDSTVMSLADKITGDVYYKDNKLECTMKEYIVYNGVKYMLINPPVIVREGLKADNGELKGMTKYSFEFYHPMANLMNIPFTDKAVSLIEKTYKSEDKAFAWVGNLTDYVAKLNKNLEDTEFIVVISDSITSAQRSVISDVMTFSNESVGDALKRGYDTWLYPYVVDSIKAGETYYSNGKRFTISFGLPTKEITRNGNPFVFEFGKGVGLKNNSRTPRNNKIVTRISGYGSENNIPYGYPQIEWTGDVSATETADGYPIYDGIVGGRVVKLIKHPFTRTHLMPSVFSDCVRRKVNSAALDYDKDIELVDYYDADGTYPNPLNDASPKYDIHEFDVKPELGETEIISATPLDENLEETSEWDDTMDDDGNYVQSYFAIKLPVLSFDLYASAAITQEMQINMRGGACLGCTFDVQVDWDEYKKSFYDSDGNFLPDGEQRDLTKFPKSNSGQITVVVRKDLNTFGTLMPNRYQYPRRGDAFVILGISMPLSYIKSAEERLDDLMKDYMLENNVYYYDYPLKFDEYFLLKNQDILSQIRNNVVLRFKFGNTQLSLYVKQTTVKYGEGVLPQYDITLTDNIEVVLNSIGVVADDVSRLAMAVLQLQNSNRIVFHSTENLQNYVNNTIVKNIADIQKQLDGQQVTYFGSVEPTLSNYPASEWAADDYEEHVGDMYYDKVSGKPYVFEYNEGDNVYQWTYIEDPDIKAALEAASKAQDTADGKRRVFVTATNVLPTPPYSEGDLWVNATYNKDGADYFNDILRCNVPAVYDRDGKFLHDGVQKGEKPYIRHWSLASKYTDDSTFNNYINQILNGVTAPETDAEVIAQALHAVKGALNENTTVDGGLILTSLISLRSGDTTWAGISGQYNASAKGHGIAAWYGGGMKDKEVSAVDDAAKSLFRFDGSGYVANGNITWDANGQVKIQGNEIKVGDSNVATANDLSAYLPLSAGSGKKLTGTLYSQHIYPKANTTYSLGSPSYWWKYLFAKRFYLLKPNSGNDDGAVYIEYDADNSGVHIVGAGLYTDSYISALGSNSDSGGGGGIADKDDVLAILGEFTSQEVFDNTDFATMTWVNANFPVNKKSTLEKITDTKINDWDATTAWYKSITGGGDTDDVINKWNEIIDFLEDVSDEATLKGLLAAKANSSVKITAGDGLTGGGDLSANRTLSVKIAQDGGLSADSEGLRISAGLVASVTKPTGTEGLLYVNYLNGDMDCIDFTRETRWADILDKPTDIEEYGIAAELGEKFVTIDTVQTVTAAKTFSAIATFTNGVKIGEATLTWDSTNRMLKINEGLYSEKAISALGANGEQGGGGGGDVSYIQFDNSVAYALDRDYTATGARVKLPAYPVASVNISGSAGNGKAVTAVTHVNGQLNFTIAELPALAAATSSKLGGIMTGFATQPTARNYKVELDSNHNAFVNVPWADTTYTFAEGTTDGTFKVTPSTTTSAIEIKIGGLKALAFKDSIAWSEITSGKPSLVTGVRRQSEGLLELTYENKTEYIDCTREVRWTDITGKPADLEEYGLLSEMNEKYVTVEWFKKLFKVHVGKDTDGSNVVEPNAEINGTDYTIEGLFGVWTQKFLSVLGANSEAGGGSGVVDEGQVWGYLADDDASLAEQEKIAKSHLSLLENLTWSYGSVTTATGSSYNGQEARNVVIPKSLSHLTNDINAATLAELNAGSVTEKRFVTPSELKQWLDGKSFGTVKKIKVGTTGSEKTPDANGVVTLDAYPTLKDLMGSTAIGADDKPIYWDGNAFRAGTQLKALAYKENLAASDIPNISWNKITSDKPTTLSGYGITDAKISGGTITLGNATITPVTSIVRESDGILEFIKGTETTYIDFTHEVRWRDVTDKPIDLEEYGILDEMKEKFVTVEFFNKLFAAYDTNGNVVNTNDTASIITNLKLMVGTWTEQYLSVLGKNTDTDGGGVVDEEQVWGYLASSDSSKKIHSSHIDYVVSGDGNALTGISVSNGGKLSFSKEYFVKTVNRNNPDGANVVTDVSYNNAGTLTVTRSKVAFLDYVTKAEDETISGKKTFSVQQAFTAAQGTSPFTVTSNTLVANLNADMLDGVHKGGLLTGLENNGNAIKLTVGDTEKTLTVGYASNAGKLNGEAASYYAKASSLEGATDDIATLKGYFTGSVANAAAKLNTATTYSAWGQTYWQNGVPNSVSGNMSGVERITFNKAASDRQLSISKGGMVSFNAASAGGWAWGLVSHTNDSSAEIGMMGFYGVGDAVNYAFVGGTYDSPHLVVMGNKDSGKKGYVGIGTESPTKTLHVNGTFGVTGTTELSSTLAVTGATTLTGLLTANGGITIPVNKTLKIGTIVLQDDNGLLKVWDGAGNVVKGIYATGTVSALGANADTSGGGTGFDESDMWEWLGGSMTNKKIDNSHLNFAIGDYLKKSITNNTQTAVANQEVVVGIEYNGSTGGLTVKKSTVTLANYLPLTGGTLTGNLKFADTNALPSETGGDYFLTVSATSNGTVKYITKGDAKTTLGISAVSGKSVVTVIDDSANLPTSKAVKTFVEGKGYISSLSFTKENDGTLKVTAGSVTNIIDMTRTVRWRDVTEKPTDLEEYGIASEVVTIAGAQTITGVKTFSNGLTAAGVNTGFIEMKPTGRTGDGGYIDFHYNNSDADFTSRIIEDSSGHLHIYADSGVYISGYVTSANEVTANSDERLKNIAGDIRLSVKDIASAPSVYFYWEDGRDKKKHIGSIAQYWKKVLPEAVSHDGQGYMSLNYQSVSLAAAIAIARETLRIGDDVLRLKRRVNELEAEVCRLRAA